MHLKVQKRDGRAYLSVVQNYRQDGKVKSRTIETIGYADEYADAFGDPIAHFREYVDQLNRKSEANRKSVALSFGVDDVIDSAVAAPMRLGARIALGCLDALGVQSCFRVLSRKGEFPGYAGRVFEMLAVERMTHVTSKRESWVARAAFPRSCDFTFAQVYEALSYCAKERSRIEGAMLRAWQRIGGRSDLKCVYLVCGNYAFPADGGMVRAGVAVALDASGMPLGYLEEIGGFDSTSICETAGRLKRRLDAGRVVVIAGGQKDIGAVMNGLVRMGDGFVLYHRDFGKSPELAAWAEDAAGYSSIGAGVRMKWRTTQRQLPDGTFAPAKEIVLRGGGYATSYDHALLVSSELDLSAPAIVQLYRELWRQAEPFQPLEADFASMPYPVPVEDHIRAHFSICYAAFFALRMLRWKMGWKYNAADTADALMHMEGMHLQQNYYLFSYRSDVTDAIERVVGVPSARRIRTRADLRSVPALVRDSFSNV